MDPNILKLELSEIDKLIRELNLEKDVANVELRVATLATDAEAKKFLNVKLTGLSRKLAGLYLVKSIIIKKRDRKGKFDAFAAALTEIKDMDGYDEGGNAAVSVPANPESVDDVIAAVADQADEFSYDVLAAAAATVGERAAVADNDVADVFGLRPDIVPSLRQTLAAYLKAAVELEAAKVRFLLPEDRAKIDAAIADLGAAIKITEAALLVWNFINKKPCECD